MAYPSLDLPTLSQKNFDVKEWIEQILRQRNDGESLDTFISNVSMKLQLMSQDLNSDLEKGLMDIVSAFPRAMSEVQRLEGSFKDLKVELGHVLSQAQKAKGAKQNAPDDPVEVLAQLHQLKSRMETCRDTLTEAANWNKLVRDVNVKFASGELTQLADQLQALKHSQQILESMPGAAERVHTVEHLEEQLGVVLKPRVQHAIQNETITALQEFAELYRKLGRLDSLISEYAKARPAQIHRYWFAYPSSDKFKDWLPGYYKQVSSMVADEKRRCHDVFGAALAPSVLASLMVETFEPLANSYHNRLNHQLSFAEVVHLHGDTLQFLSEQCAFIGMANAQEALPIVTTVLEPYLDFVRRYEELENASLEAWLSSSLAATQEILSSGLVDDGDGSSLDRPLPVQMEEILDLVTGAFPVVDKLVQRCLRFTSGYHGRELVQLVNRFLTSDVARFGEIFAAARKRCGLSKAGGRASPLEPEGGLAAASRPHTFEWDYLQGALRLLQAFGRHFRQLSACEKSLIRSLAEMFAWVFESNEAEGDGHALSPRAMCLIWVRSLLQERAPDRAELRGFLRTFTEPVLPGDLLKGPFRSANMHSSEARRLVFDVCISLVKDRLAQLPSLPVWSAEESGDSDAGYYYSSVPQQYITQVGDHILSLIQHLEDFAASDALQEVSTVMTGLDRLGEPEWREAGAALGLNEVEISLLLKHSAHSPDDEHGAAADEALHFCNCWLGCISQATVAILLGRVSSIPRLSAKGSSQLETDTRYLLTVFQNLEVRPHPVLAEVNELVALPLQELEDRIRGGGSGADRGGLGLVFRKVERRIAQARGIQDL